MVFPPRGQPSSHKRSQFLAQLPEQDREQKQRRARLQHPPTSWRAVTHLTSTCRTRRPRARAGPARLRRREPGRPGGGGGGGGPAQAGGRPLGVGSRGPGPAPPRPLAGLVRAVPALLQCALHRATCMQPGRAPEAPPEPLGTRRGRHRRSRARGRRRRPAPSASV